MQSASGDVILNEFKVKLEGYTRQAACGRYFVLVDSLQNWLRSPAEGGTTYADRLLHGVAYRHRHLPGVPISPDKLIPGNDCCLLVFCILHMLGHGDLIYSFSRREKVDRMLPFSFHDLQDIYRSSDIDDPDFVSRFLDLQDRFRPARFDLHNRTAWNEHMVVPICRRNPIKEGATASLWQVDVPEEFVGQKLRDAASGSRFNANTDEEPDWVRGLAFDLTTPFSPLNIRCLTLELDDLLRLDF